MSLRFFHGKIGPDYGWELDLLRKYREWCDGFTLLSFVCEFDRYMCDHKPSFVTMLVLFNIKVFEFNIYNIWHVDHTNSPYYKQYLEEENENSDSK